MMRFFSLVFILLNDASYLAGIYCIIFHHGIIVSAQLLENINRNLLALD